MSTAPFRQWSEPNPWVKPDPLPVPITTARTIIRPFEMADAPSLLAALEVDRSKIVPWMAWANDENLDIPGCHFTIERFRRQHAGPACNSYVLGVFDRGTGEVIGGTGLHDIRAYWRQAEIGYWLRPDRWGRGLMPEAVSGLISSAFRPVDAGGWGLRRIVIYCAEQNRNSARVCEKLGLRVELRAKMERYVEGLGYHDCLGFAVLADEWDGVNHRPRVTG